MTTDLSDIPVKKANLKWVKTILKIGVTLLCLWYISTKINFIEIVSIWSKSNLMWVPLAVLSFSFSKLLAAFRLNIYFRSISIAISEWINIKLYWLGMFYNLFLPGSIGGDAYKVIKLSKDFNVAYKKTTSAVLLDRFSGLFALVLLTAFLWFLVFDGKYYSIFILIGALLIIPISYFAVRMLFPYFSNCFFPTYLWGILVQIFQMVTMFCILQALYVTANYPEYLLLFMISSVVAVIPFTIGGLGGRELVFLWGAQFLHLDMPTAVAASVLFYFTTVISSSFGIPMVFRNPLKEEKN